MQGMEFLLVFNKECFTKLLFVKKKKAGSISAGNKHVTSLKMWESICY